ncbi:F-box LRR-repeat 13-like isoform X2 [Chlorella sorokiniana]|uniref:F-box LRR-repeat 13-like isoform X2 n=1 Tax=Chlorella sorokiniana TaxID=3076 RepID=A0A2P6TCN4_CHLSO|nr:F-box LRR-repeat 13-like isoform X2 [Chlorella sorokiniana]|eukprot:PRW20405.1 F-box LRR-repeat 13-like isoform X2 [Chlorella sorokiniana]
MATRRQQAAPSRQPAAPRAQGVDQLPDDLLTRILGCLSLRERQVATLVSRRWHRCAHAPELCREVEWWIRMCSCRPPSAPWHSMDALAMASPISCPA